VQQVPKKWEGGERREWGNLEVVCERHIALQGYTRGDVTGAYDLTRHVHRRGRVKEGRVAEMVPTGWGMLKVVGEWVLDQPKFFCTGDNLSSTKCICHWSVVWKGIFFEATCGMDES
jgi:hypothetical protein